MSLVRAGKQRNLHVAVRGTGPEVVLLHGWGLHGGIWDEFAPALAEDYRVVSPDLPGHGRSPARADTDWTLEAVTQDVLDAAPQHALWIGWSLGGLIAIHAAASRKQRVAGLVLLAATPRFVIGNGWTHGMAAAVLEAFARELEQDWHTTLRRFLALQTLGCVEARQALRRLRGHLLAHGAPVLPALRGGLRLLMECDLRDRLAGLQCPVLVLTGERDRLMPAAAGTATARLLPQGRSALHMVRGAGHAPFLTHREECLRVIRDFFAHAGQPDTSGQGGS